MEPLEPAYDFGYARDDLRVTPKPPRNSEPSIQGVDFSLPSMLYRLESQGPEAFKQGHSSMPYICKKTTERIKLRPSRFGRHSLRQSQVHLLRLPS